MNKTEETIVIFRKWKDTRSIIALFPEIPADPYGVFCQCYEHIGQHGGGDYFQIIECTTPATPFEYKLLAEELVKIGYRLKIEKKASSKNHQNRREEYADKINQS